MRAEDVLVAARFLAEHGSKKGTGLFSPKGPKGAPQKRAPSPFFRPVRVIAIGEAGPPALHAVALEGRLFQSLTLRRSLVSWSNAVHTPVTHNVLVHAVHGALATYDLPDLAAAIGPNKLTIEQPIGASGHPIGP